MRPVTTTWRARFHCQRASSTSHAATNITASASGRPAPIQLGRQRASATVAATASIAASPRSTGSGSSCRSAPPTTVLIEAPLHASKVVQSRNRPASCERIVSGSSVTPETRTVSAAGKRSASAMPFRGPIQFGSRAATTGARRSASSGIASVNVRPGLNSLRHRRRASVPVGSPETCQATPR